MKATKMKGTDAFAGILAVYDLEEAKLECRQQRLRPKVAIAWLLGGRVQTSVDREYFATHSRVLTPDKIYRKWLKQLGSSISKKSVPEESFMARQTNQRYVQCVVASKGASWHTWREEDVYSRLISDDPKWTIMPLEDTIFDPDDESLATLGSLPDTKASCIDLGKSMLWEIARVYYSAVELIEDFEQAFEAVESEPDDPVPWNERERPAWLIYKCKEATLDMISCISILMASEQPDAARHLKQGFRIGKRLAQAEAIISNTGIALQAKMGGGRPGSKFWEWVNKDPRFAGKGAKEVWLLLDGCEDLDHPGQKLAVQDDVLVRGDSSKLKEASFTARFKKHR